MDRIPDENHRALVPEWLGRNIVDRIPSNALSRPNDLPEEGLLLLEYVEQMLPPLVAPDLVSFHPPGLLGLRERDKPGDLAGRADMVPDEGPLAKDKVQCVRRRRKGQAAGEPAGTHQTGVLREGSAGVDELAGAGVNAIAAEQHRAFGGGAVGEGSDHSWFACHLNVVQLLAKGHLEALAQGFFTQNPAQGASLDDQAWDSHLGAGAIGHLSKTLAFPSCEGWETLLL